MNNVILNTGDLILPDGVAVKIGLGPFPDWEFTANGKYIRLSVEPVTPSKKVSAAETSCHVRFSAGPVGNGAPVIHEVKDISLSELAAAVPDWMLILNKLLPLLLPGDGHDLAKLADALKKINLKMKVLGRHTLP